MKMTKRLTAVALVLLLLLSLCGCVAEKLTPAGQGGNSTTTAEPTQVTTTASSAPTTTATDTQPGTAETTVATTQVTTKVTVTVTDPTAAPTTAAPTVKPLVEWTVIEEKAKEGPLPGTAIDFIKVKTFYDEHIDDFTEKRLRDKACVVIEDKKQFDALFTNVYDPEYTNGVSAQLDYSQDFFEENALIVLEQVSSDTNCAGYWITGMSVDNGTLYANIFELELAGGGGSALTAFRVLIEVSRADIQAVDSIQVYYDLREFEDIDDYVAWYKEHIDRFVA